MVKIYEVSIYVMDTWHIVKSSYLNATEHHITDIGNYSLKTTKIRQNGPSFTFVDRVFPANNGRALLLQNYVTYQHISDLERLFPAAKTQQKVAFKIGQNLIPPSPLMFL